MTGDSAANAAWVGDIVAVAIGLLSALLALVAWRTAHRALRLSVAQDTRSQLVLAMHLEDMKAYRQKGASHSVGIFKVEIRNPSTGSNSVARLLIELTYRNSLGQEATVAIPHDGSLAAGLPGTAQDFVGTSKTTISQDLTGGGTEHLAGIFPLDDAIAMTHMVEQYRVVALDSRGTRSFCDSVLLPEVTYEV